jgi:hypothetical protein
MTLGITSEEIVLLLENFTIGDAGRCSGVHLQEPFLKIGSLQVEGLTSIQNQG